MKDGKKRREYYKFIRQMAAEGAENNSVKALSSQEYRALKLKQYLLKATIAQKEVWEDKARADKLRAEYDDCEKQAEAVLRSMNLTPADLLPKYVCQKCRDTGYAHDGNFCDCYPGDEMSEYIQKQKTDTDCIKARLRKRKKRYEE